MSTMVLFIQKWKVLLLSVHSYACYSDLLLQWMMPLERFPLHHQKSFNELLSFYSHCFDDLDTHQR